jgi:hypothetical protein
VGRHGANRAGRAPQSDLTIPQTQCPRWETFPPGSRTAAVQALSLLVERMTSLTVQGGGESGERIDGTGTAA